MGSVANTLKIVRHDVLLGILFMALNAFFCHLKAFPALALFPHNESPYVKWGLKNVYYAVNNVEN